MGEQRGVFPQCPAPRAQAHWEGGCRVGAIRQVKGSLDGPTNTGAHPLGEPLPETLGFGISSTGKISKEKKSFPHPHPMFSLLALSLVTPSQLVPVCQRGWPCMCYPPAGLALGTEPS